MTGVRGFARGVRALALVLPLSGLGLLAAATPASAGGGITNPGNGVTYAADTTVRIRADITGTSQVQLKLKSPAPGSTAQTVASGAGTLTGGSTLAYDLDTSCATYPSSSCSGRAPALNGVWTVTLTGGASDSSTFVLRIAPQAPTGVTAQADGYRAVIVGWTKGAEPDLTGWTLYGDGGIVQDGIGLGACSAGSCSTTVTYPQDGTGTHTYSLVAHRSVSPGSSTTVDSARSAQVSATLGAPPPSPKPTSSGAPTSGSGGSGGSSSPASSGASPGATAGGGTPGGAGKNASAGAATPVVPDARAFALTFQQFAPKLGIPKLPPLPAAAPLLAEAPLPDGTYQTTLGYKPIVERQRVSAPATAVSRVSNTVSAAFDSEQFLRSIAGALVLLLAAAHLRRWLRGGPAD